MMEEVSWRLMCRGDSTDRFYWPDFDLWFTCVAHYCASEKDQPPDAEKLFWIRETQNVYFSFYVLPVLKSVETVIKMFLNSHCIYFIFIH